MARPYRRGARPVDAELAEPWVTRRGWRSRACSSLPATRRPPRLEFAARHASPAVGRLWSAKLTVMTVIAVADMYGIEAAREDLAGLFERFERDAQREPGCVRYTFAATVADPTQFVLLSEWESQDAMDAHYQSRLFADFQFSLQGLLARPSELTIYSADRAVRPQDTAPMDPRDAD